MKLNADILYENLKKTFPAEITGVRSSEMRLRRPEFYLEDSGTFQKDHLYIIPGDRFPRHPGIEKGCCIICSCNVPNLSNYQNRCCIIRLKNKEDPFAVSNAVTEIYDRYGNWSRQLSRILEESADLNEMVDLTSHLFGNPMLVLDSEFRFVATAGYENLKTPPAAFDRAGSDNLSISALNQFLDSMDTQFEKREPLLINIGDRSSLSCNLFDMDEYIGSVTVEYRTMPHADGDEALLKYFSKFLSLALQKHTQFITSDRNLVRNVLGSLLNERPVDSESRRRIESLPHNKHWVCVVLRPNERFSQVPVTYVCSQMEKLFSYCIAFSYQSNIVGFLAADGMPKDPDFRDTLNQQLDKLTGDSEVKIGISSDFSDLFSARLYYLQAVSALENGSILDSQGSHYYFRDYALTELIINAQNDLPLEMYYADGLKRLFEHDANSSTSYVETLRIYLNNNMSVTATSAALHIHRSTLLERLARIRRELWEDLEDPDIRLRLQIILKALEIQDEVARLQEEQH